MPSFPPRTNPVKKQQQLEQREQELRLAIRKNLPPEKLLQTAEKYRAAKLSLLKATIHALRDKALQTRTHDALTVADLEQQIELWQNKTVEVILTPYVH